MACHRSATDEVVCRLVKSASYRRDPAGFPLKLGSILGTLDALEHPAAPGYRIARAVTQVDSGNPPTQAYQDLTGRLRRLGPVAARGAERLLGDWSGTLDELLTVAAGVAADPGPSPTIPTSAPAG